MSWLQNHELVYLAALAIAFAGVVSLVLGARYLAGGRSAALRARLRKYTSPPPIPGLVVPEAADNRALLAVTLAPLARLAEPRGEEEQGRLRARLSQAGWRGERAVTTYLGVKVLAALGLGGVAAWLVARLVVPALPGSLIVIGAVAAGFYAPSLVLAARASARMAELDHSLINALDLLVTCIEAGLGLDEAMNRVAAEIGLSAPLLAAELRQSALEIAAGLGRGDAFRRMAERTGVEEVRLLAAIIVQTEMFGTSVARSLRVQAKSMRVRRTQVAEERAAAVGVKMTIPLIFCIVPSLFVVLLGPGAVRIARQLLPTLLGGH